MFSKIIKEFLCFIFSLWASLTVFLIGVTSINYFSLINPEASIWFLLWFLIGVLLLTYFTFHILVHYLREDVN